MEVLRDIFHVSEIVKFEGHDCVILEIEKNSLGWNEYKLWDIENGETYKTIKTRIMKSNIETLTFNDVFSVPEIEVTSVDEFHQNEGNTPPLLPSVKSETTSTDAVDIKHRHSRLSLEDLDKIAEANCQKNTSYQTKWAVCTLRGCLLKLILSKAHEFLVRF